MPRSVIPGTTDYRIQSFEDMILDFRGYIRELKKALKTLKVNIRKLKQLKYWDKVDWDFQRLVEYSIKFYDTAIVEISDILGEIQEEVGLHHVRRARQLGETAAELNVRYGRIWHQEYRNKEYSNKDFKLVERLYEEGRNMALSMKDLSNLAERLDDFVGKKVVRKEKGKSIMDALELKPNWFGLGINLKKLASRLTRNKKP